MSDRLVIFHLSEQSTEVKMRWLVLGLFCLTLLLAHTSGRPKRKFSNKNKRCSMQLFRLEDFRGEHVTLHRSKRSLRHGEKSLKTISKCCWKICRYESLLVPGELKVHHSVCCFSLPRGRGRCTTINGNESLPRPRIGHIRSVRKLTRC